MPRISLPDVTCPYCDGGDCMIKRMLESSWHGIRCDGFNKGGKENCKINQNANKEGLILFMKN